MTVRHKVPASSAVEAARRVTDDLDINLDVEVLAALLAFHAGIELEEGP